MAFGQKKNISQEKKIITKNEVIIRIMVFPLDDNFVFGDNFFFWLIIFFSPKATKKITQPRKKKLLTNKRSYSSNGNTIIPMILRFYATPPPPFFSGKSRKKIWGYNCNHLIYREYIFTSKYFQYCFPEI